MTPSIKKILVFLALSVLTGHAYAQDIPAYSAPDLVQRVSDKDTIYIVNFWATWCIPCVGELPEFAALYHHYQGKPVKIIMVSCNLEAEYPEKLQAYVAEKHMEQEVVWLRDTDIDYFRPVIDERWSGQIPSTIIFDNKRQQRYIIEEVTTAQAIEDILGD